MTQQKDAPITKEELLIVSSRNLKQDQEKLLLSEKEEILEFFKDFAMKCSGFSTDSYSDQIIADSFKDAKKMKERNKDNA